MTATGWTIGAALAAATVVSGCAGPGSADCGLTPCSRYDCNRSDPSCGGNDAGRCYRDDRRYRERRRGRNDPFCRGQDGPHCCRRSDRATGQTGGKIAGDVLGNVIAPGGFGIPVTILGAVGGAAAGRRIDRNGARSR
jgi:hypothetical protein